MNHSLHYGRPDTTNYDQILDLFSMTRLNSVKTSTVPLLQYWKSTSKSLDKLEKCISIKFDNPQLCFEYATPSFKSNKSSMTDLMIIDSYCKIAIEAKYTEYAKGKYEKITDWLLKGENEKNRKNVIEHWLKKVGQFVQSIRFDGISNLPYQFLHRSASACYENDGKAIVVYQLFYDNETKPAMGNFISDFKSWVEILQPKENLDFYVFSIETKLAESVNKIEEIIEAIKQRDVYVFGKEQCEQITIR